jgi:hypothetical protein
LIDTPYGGMVFRPQHLLADNDVIPFPEQRLDHR